MYNEIIRKITSLTLMTIMLAGGMTIAFPGFTPDAYAVNANLIVSAENTGYVDGAQIVEILIIDDDLAGLPDVTVNGVAVAMTSTNDGNWYAYIADTDAVAEVDNTTGNTSGIDFGDTTSCSVVDSDSNTIYCNTKEQNVPASAKTSSTAGWPFIQTYAFPTNVEIEYNKGGDTQTTVLAFDDNAGGLSLDRSVYPQGAQVHVTIGDHRLNIDPTSSDFWSWNMETGDKYYGDTVGFVAVSYVTAHTEEAEEAFATANSTLTKKQTALDDANTALDEKQATLDDAEKASNTDYNLVLANEALTTAQRALTTANDTLTTAQGTLNVTNVALTAAQDTLDAAIDSVSLAQIDTDERHLNLAKAYSDAAQRAAASATDGLGLITLNNTEIAVTQVQITAATTEVGNADTAATDAETAYTAAIDATGEELETLATVTAKGGYDKAVSAADAVAATALESETPHTHTADTTEIDAANTAITDNSSAVPAALTAVTAAQTAVTDARTAVERDQAAVDTAQTAFNTAQAEFDTAEGERDALLTGVTDAKAEFDTAKGERDALLMGVADAQTAVNTAQAELDAVGNAESIDSLKTSQVCGDCSIEIDFNGQSSLPVVQIKEVDNRPIPSSTDQEWFTVREVDGPNTSIFSGTNLSNESILTVTDGAPRDSSATITYDGDVTGILVKHSQATISIDSPDDVWTSGLSIPIAIVDGDTNKNSLDSDDVVLTNPDSIIPTLVTGDPFTLGETSSNLVTWIEVDGVNTESSATVELFSERALLSYDTSYKDANYIVIDIQNGFGELQDTLIDNRYSETGYNFLNYNIESLGVDITSIDILVDGTVATTIDGLTGQSGYVAALNDLSDLPASGSLLQLKLNFAADLDVEAGKVYPIVIDFFSFGFANDGEASDERIANQIIRLLLEESDDDTASLEGTLEYIMINQLNIDDQETYEGLSTISDEVSFIVIEDLTGSSAPSVTYLDVDTTGTQTQVSAQEDAPSHSAVVTLDVDSFKAADTVTVTLEDLDLNVDSGLVDIYTVVNIQDDANQDAVGEQYGAAEYDGVELGRLLDITFDDQRWMTHTDEAGNECTDLLNDHSGLGDTGFRLVETGDATGIFVGTFAIPAEFCRQGSSEPESITGLDIEVNYVDFRDASGETTEVGDSAGIKASTGSVSFDRTVYPVPFGVVDDFDDSTSTTPSQSNTDTRSLFPIHQSGMNDDSGLQSGEFLPQGDLIVYVTVTDPDFDVSASGKDTIAVDDAPVTVSVIRGSQSVTIAKIGDTSSPIDEIAPDAGIFEASVTMHYYDGPDSSICPSTSVAENTPSTDLNGRTGDHDNDRDTPDKWITSIDPRDDYCILQGDILQVEYNDPTDASGQPNTVTDSATFDLRNGVLQSDKSVYIIGSDMILTLIEPDFDLDSSQNETYDLDLIKWSSSAATVTMGDADGEIGAFDPEPLSFRETGPSTGIFQIVVEIPQVLDGSSLQRGEEIDLEYTDWGPSGSDYVGDEDEDVRLTVFTSNFGATIDLDQKVYSWTDKVYITVVAPDHNFDNNLIDEIGETDEDPLRVATKGFDLDSYRLVETGFDTGIFTGEVILTGFAHDPTGDGNKVVPRTSGDGPTDGYLETPSDGGISVSYEFSEDETVFTSSIIRWNIGDVQWLEASYPASGTGVLRVIDPDMNLNPEAVDNFDVNIASHTDASGITLTVTETNEATGIFEGTVFFTTTGGSSGHRLRVSEGDTVTADYADGTLPLPYTTNDQVSITSTTIIGTIVPPLERAPATNLRIVDTFGSSIDAVSVDQQVQITADLSSGQDKDQDFAYLIQIQNSDGVTVSLSWIAGSLSPDKQFSPSGSWTPTDAGTYTVTVFVWESIDNPTALSPSLTIDVSVN